MKSLVLDDFRDIAEIIAAVLEESNVTHEIYLDPLEAMKGMNGDSYDFAFIDINLPNMDGIEFAKSFKERFPEADVIFITGYTDYDKVVKAIKIGAYDFLQKPFKYLDIKMCVKRLIEKRRLYQDQKKMEILKFANAVALQLMHELRNPLVAIGGFSRLVSSKDYSEGNVKKYTKIIYEETLRLENVLTEVLTHLRTDSQHIFS
jgi:DNA-binding NtrC family response regulator